MTLATIKMTEILDFDIWEKLMGKLILSCARVEYELMQLYKFWLPNRNYYEDSCENRYDKAIGVTKEKLGKNHPMIEEMIKMKSIALYRHIIAHNPIHFSNEHNEWRIFDLKTNSESLNLSELKKLANNAELNSIKLSANLRINIKNHYHQ